ncbi:uncharacterized protein LOC134836478 [Culicoides brevitarsis]|uniref:uncharacterized protein LOC134836478 n=1 Tax=Culicoides brevitarsis TaxID=469753 RepID=UPI00307C9C82
MDSMSQKNFGTPATSSVRRYRRTPSNRSVTKRDQTPDPSSRVQSSQRNTDDDSCSSADFFFANNNGVGRSPSVSVPTSPVAVTAPSSPFKEMSPAFPVNNNEEKPENDVKEAKKFPEVEAGGHMSKILSRRNKAKNAAKAHRSQSTPRKESETQTSTTAVITYTSDVPISKRSMSLPRHKEDSSESDAALVARLTIPAPAYQPQFSTTDPRGLQLEMNMKKFEEDRKKFELEKLRFIQQKRELDRMRLARFEKYREEIAAKEPSKGLTPFALHEKDLGVRPDSPMPRKSKSKSRERRSKSSMKKHKDYVSSTVDASDESDYEQRRLKTRLASKSPRRKSSRSRTPVAVSKTPDITIDSVDEYFDINKNSIQDLGKALQVRRRNVKNDTDKQANGTNGVAKEVEIRNDDETKKLLVPIFVDAYAHKPNLPKTGLRSYLYPFYYESKIVWKQLKAAHPKEVLEIRTSFKRCLCMWIAMLILCGTGGLIFRHLEGNWENMYKCGTKRIRRTFIDDLWKFSQNLREDDWKTKARTTLKQFEEELQIAYDAGVKSYSGITVWSFINSALFCLTVVTTIGYGHIVPKTTAGKALTIVYSIIGVPLFLIILADFGKLLTRIIKFLWAYVRRLYYTGTCKKVRKQSQVQGVMRGINVMYDMARRPSQMVTTLGVMQTQTPTSTESHPPSCDSPTLPDIEIDDEFNLPISLALSILIIYMLFGAAVYKSWESWSFFDSFYFVFISMSTIGFGDLVPDHPMFMMASIIYLIFGLALTSMCINVVQIKLSDTFRAASAKLGATIGLQPGAETASVGAEHTPVELAGVHVGQKDGI